jgi:hypothetical protein
MAKKSSLRLLAETILDAVSIIDGRFEGAGLECPSLSDPFNPMNPATALLFHPDIAAQGSLIYAAADQLLASVRPPPLVMMDSALAVS